MGERTKVFGAGKDDRYPRTTIPVTIARIFGIKPGDELDWDIEVINGEKVIVLRKVEG